MNLVQQAVAAAKAYAQQVESVRLQVLNSVQQPLNLVNQIQTQVSNYATMLNQARMLSFQAANTVRDFESVFNVGGYGAADLLAKAQRMQQALKESGWTAAQAQAIYESLCVQSDNLNRAMTASASSSGQLSAIQAQSQVLGVIASQQVELQKIAAASERVQTGFVMMQITEKQQEQLAKDHWIDNFGSNGFKPLGQ